MRILLHAPALALAAGAFAAAPPPSPFPDQSIGVPPLSLLDGAKSGPLPLLGDARTFYRSAPPPAPPSRPAFVSGMPVLEPRSDLAPRMQIKRPDEAVDYKMAVKVPEVASAAGR